MMAVSEKSLTTEEAVTPPMYPVFEKAIRALAKEGEEGFDAPNVCDQYSKQSKKLAQTVWFEQSTKLGNLEGASRTKHWLDLFESCFSDNIGNFYCIM